MPSTICTLALPGTFSPSASAGSSLEVTREPAVLSAGYSHSPFGNRCPKWALAFTSSRWVPKWSWLRHGRHRTFSESARCCKLSRVISWLCSCSLVWLIWWLKGQSWELWSLSWRSDRSRRKRTVLRMISWSLSKGQVHGRVSINNNGIFLMIFMP